MGEQAEKEFNLLDEPWILVKTFSGEVKEWSLLELFRHAHEVQSLAGELPTQDVAVMRLLLAIMHGAFITSDVDDEDMALQRWQELWEEKQFMYGIVADYLEKYRERFWLFHPEQPFYQVADFKSVMDAYRVKNEKGFKIKEEEKLKTVARLHGELFQSDHTPRLFPVRTGEGQKAIFYAEAARWLLHLNGFDDDSAKKPTPKGVGYLGQLGLVYAQGENLFETLMLNFVLLDERNELFDDYKEEAKAYWEKPVCKRIANLVVQPRAQKDLLTMQSRRILLNREDGGKVNGYLLTMGDYFDEEQSLVKETMTLWEWCKDGNANRLQPKQHKPERQIWRDFSSLLCEAGDKENKMAGVIYWLKLLQKEKIFSHDNIKICIAGVYYKFKGGGWQIVDYMQDSLQVNSFLFKELGDLWVHEIKEALSKMERAVQALGCLSADIVAAEGNSNESKTAIAQRAAAAQRMREEGYHLLDGEFRQWLLSLREMDEKEEKLLEWSRRAKGILLRRGEELLEECSETALFVVNCKEDKDSKSVGKVNAFEAFRKFKRGIVKELGQEK